MDILITGANGHLGHALVAEMLAAGHRVRGGLRSLADRAARARLEALGPVRPVQTDLDRPAGLAPALAGVDVVVHAAAVYSLCEPGRAAETLRVATEGTAVVLRAAAEAGVGRVVLTSTVLTVPLTRPGAAPSTEADWNDDLRVPYVRAKTEGERQALALADELGLSLATLLPGAIGGPGFVRNTPSIDLVEAMMRGAFRAGVPRLNLPYVDVRDVARAHRLAAEAGARGRFIVVGDELPDFRTVVETMHRIDPRVARPGPTLPDWLLPAVPLVDRLNTRLLGTPRTAPPEMIAMMRGRRYNASNQRAKEVLGWRPAIGLAESLADTMAALRAREVAPARSAPAAAPRVAA